MADEFDFSEWINSAAPPSKEGALPVEPVIESLEELSVAVPEIQRDPREAAMDELLKSIENLTNQVKGYEEDVMGPIKGALSEIAHTRDDATKTYKALVEELNRQDSERRTELYNARNEKYALDEELTRLQREHANLLKSIAAEKMLAEIQDKIDHLIMDAPWGMAARKYQLLDLKYMIAAFESGKSGVLNANDMGLGKTFETIILIYCLRHLFQEKYGYAPAILWLTAPSLIRQTIKEFKKWDSSARVIPCEGSWNSAAREFATEMAVEQQAVLVANYQQMNTNKKMMAVTWDIIVNDEVSMLKGGAQASPTKIWTNMKQLIWECTVSRNGDVNFTDPYSPVQKCKFYVPLSGTPIQNKPGDMWAYLHLFAPTKFPKLKRFEDEYAYGWPQLKLSSQDVERIINVMDGQVIRRSKDDELDLPAKIPNWMEVQMTEKQRELYNQMRDNFFIWIDNKKEEAIQTRVVISWIIRLWQIALFPGMMKGFDADMNEIPMECQESGVLDRAMDIIEGTVGAGQKLAVWSSWFNGPLTELKKRCDEAGIKAALYTGEQNTYQRNLAVESFQSTEDDSVQVMLLNRAAGGMGLDGLQCAHTCVLLDLWWNYAANDQMVDRQHRSGQKEHLMVHFLQAEDSVYSFVKAKADAKQEMAESIMESRELRKGGDWKDYLTGLI